MRKIDWTPIIWITAILIVILIVYYIFEKRIEAIPDKINLEKPTGKDSLLSAGKLPYLQYKTNLN
ncbi:hypothetical protein [Algoriphagus sp.]|jgi:hypothetical protein|uniref:hypothetical protein n=1 Tax=Algoriphagus sp. TaxID=1872435 RepID=UPI00271AAF52|nr:hypothetical protein [Algoriphagus sp.]MDO8966347.1 hypothetical protein [Algoriphagus sp.]MDP3198226.1 hypothetical protein [Algoriphagus sp.]